MIPSTEYVALAGQRDFDVSFPYLSTAHVRVMVNGELYPQLEWLSPTRLRLAAALVGGETVVIERYTPIEQMLVKFQDGSILTSEDLNKAVEQLLYKQQEITGLYDSTLRRARIRILEANGVPVTADDVALEVARIASENVLLDDFRSRLADIDANATNIAALAGQVDQLLGGDPGEGVTTLIAEETAARIEGDEALIDTLAVIGARSGDGLSFIADLNKLKVSPTETFAQRFSTINSSLASNGAAISNEATTRANADSALSQQITTLGTTVGNNSATLTTLAQTVNGIQARYGVSLDVNGYVTGFVQNNNGTTGTFDILADKFRVVAPGLTPKQVFQVDANGVLLDGNLRVNGNLIVNGTLPTQAVVQNAISVSAYLRVLGMTDLIGFPLNNWADLTTGSAPAPTTGGSGGGTGGGTGTAPAPTEPTPGDGGIGAAGGGGTNTN